ncbi:methyl-accepting chemotaxis protein [Blastopirellula retiformator]|uniref:Methyl-accepting chemotaxis protein 4 n=1 Tax=Blastopirellula retiformator TaxID=2527970 RepID=A0A5C5V4Y6_9BACT|nr:methyl-accepting chemotaxis protein [Blastopirellula retiformator]TWT32837.1 Methyl-accepting chemotaxis protein 4 [Blastopirellula retiformator]
MSIGKKILLLSLAGPIACAVVIIVIVAVNGRALDKTVLEQAEQMAYTQCESVSSNVRIILDAQNTLTKQQLNSTIQFSEELFNERGKLVVQDERLNWKCRNQYTGEITDLQLPGVAIGDAPLGQVDDLDQQVAFVDDVTKWSGGTCTIFQKMNDQGDMLRVATSVEGSDGKRAIGSYIPAVNPNGEPNPVVDKLLHGEPYYGRAFVVNRWYSTAYHPVTDDSGELIGALYVGLLQEDAADLPKRLESQNLGDSGYVFVVQGSGKDKGTYLVSKNGARNGENILDTIDAQGKPCIREMIDKAQAADDGEIVSHEYYWKNEGDQEAREKLAMLFYYEPWDWVVGISIYKDDYRDSALSTRNALNWMAFYVIAGALAVVAVISILAVFGSRLLVKPIKTMTDSLRDIAQGEGDLTKRLEIASHDEIGELANWFNVFMDKLQTIISQVANCSSSLSKTSGDMLGTAEDLSSGAEEAKGRSTSVAAASEEMATTMTEMSSSLQNMTGNLGSVSTAITELTNSITEISRNTETASTVARNASNLAQHSNEKITRLNDSAVAIGKIVSVIEDIAEQTNLLALNATIEAARAGEAGKGFSVVATEVKQLAQQTTKAIDDIRQTVAGINDSSADAVKSISEITDVISQIREASISIASAIEEQSLTTKQISTSLNQTNNTASAISSGVHDSALASREITENVIGVDKATKRTAENASTTRSYGDSLARYAKEIDSLVGGFKV